MDTTQLYEQIKVAFNNQMPRNQRTLIEVLEIICNDPGIKSNNIAKKATCSVSTAFVAIRELRQKGIIDKENKPTFKVKSIARGWDHILPKTIKRDTLLGGEYKYQNLAAFLAANPTVGISTYNGLTADEIMNDISKQEEALKFLKDKEWEIIEWLALLAIYSKDVSMYKNMVGTITPPSKETVDRMMGKVTN